MYVWVWNSREQIAKNHRRQDMQAILLCLTRLNLPHEYILIIPLSLSMSIDSLYLIISMMNDK